MEYIFLPPAYDLKDYVSHFWAGTWNAAGQSANNNHIIIANSLLEITFAFEHNRKGAELLFATVQGHTDQPRRHTVPAFYHLFGVCIYSHAIPNLFGLPAAELNNEYLSLNTFLASVADRLSEKVATAATTEERVRILTDFFRMQLKQQSFADKMMLSALLEIKKHHSGIKVAELAKKSYLSQKQFNRRFKDFTGFNPKAFTRITRLEAAINSYSPTASLTALAHANGYYDQPHFIHEFKTLTGFNPGDFWKLSEADGE